MISENSCSLFRSSVSSCTSAAAACALGLDFVPVGVEEYDLVIPQRYTEDERILALLDVIRSEAFRKEVAALGGYGVEKTGQVIWEYDGR